VWQGRRGDPSPYADFKQRAFRRMEQTTKKRHLHSVEVFSLPVVKELEISVRNVRRNA
jgi:hypothetical protein